MTIIVSHVIGVRQTEDDPNTLGEPEMDRVQGDLQRSSSIKDKLVRCKVFQFKSHSKVVEDRLQEKSFWVGRGDERSCLQEEEAGTYVCTYRDFKVLNWRAVHERVNRTQARKEKKNSTIREGDVLS